MNFLRQESILLISGLLPFANGFLTGKKSGFGGCRTGKEQGGSTPRKPLFPTFNPTRKTQKSQAFYTWLWVFWWQRFDLQTQQVLEFHGLATGDFHFFASA